MSFMNIYELIRFHLSPRSDAVVFAIQGGLIKEKRLCSYCKKQMAFIEWKNCLGLSRAWECKCCRYPKYRINITARKGTWMSKSQMTSTETVCDWYTYFLKVCCEIVNRRGGQINGPSTIVEVDEGEFGTRKYNRGRFVDSQWVLGGYCRETKKSFMVPVPTRNRNTLIPITREIFLPGTTIISDC
ncbi:hypothetical protein RF11_04525 [Thelohanellus kitauei]|uniref:ISXO2-like transposase domain-containing protein n=1 Tax=Thelohanellus kitauei TaxID=669202 RepID=A0A0C2N1A3_THEKT|nr:hypothetical protein RF11_04525 [Thelohanellus kitauei]